MGYVRTIEAPTGWEAEVARLADDRHLAAWSGDSGERIVFAARLGSFWQGQADTEVVRLFGTAIHSIDDLCTQIERSIPGDGPIRRRIAGPAGIASRLRHRSEFPGRSQIRFRYIIWHDADELIRSDAGLFSAAIDAIAGVAAESEYASDDMLLVTRAVYVGGSHLSDYADDESGQLRSWLHDGTAEPFWRAVSGVDRPPVLAAPIGRLLDDPEGLATQMLLDGLELDDALGY